MYKTPFKNLVINLVKHDDSPTGLPCYIEAHVGSVLAADRGALVLDLGNYIYRELGLSYQMIPEYRGRGKAQTLRWFMSWNDVAPILGNIKQVYGIKHQVRTLPFAFQTLIIQDKARGVLPNPRVA